MLLRLTVALGLLLCTAPVGARSVPAQVVPSGGEAGPARAALDRLAAACASGACGFTLDPELALDTVLVDGAARRVEARFSRALSHTPWVPDEAARFEALVADTVGAVLPGYDAAVTVALHPGLAVALDALVPHARRPPVGGDAVPAAVGPPLVRRLDAATAPTRGLAGRHVALWPSHGWYYEASLDRWEWQRARVFTTVEDLFPFAFVVNELTPMLERAGAVVLLPRERDTNPNEAVVDADGSTGVGEYVERGDWRTGGPGFAYAPPYGDGVNPFRLGQHRLSAGRDAEAEWNAEVPEAGEYAVYVSYGAHDGASEDARFTVRHAGGETAFAVNQTMAGGTWVYLGTFRFERGPGAARVTLRSGDGRPVSADAVRLGGGMGNVTRGGRTSGRPRYTEAARYYMQFAGFPDSTVYNVSRTLDDYKDDYQSRGEWVNELRGAPFGPSDHRQSKGFGVPVDVSVAFHTDAGTTSDGTVVGTLAIYNTLGMDSTGVFPDGVPRLVNRDLADRVQTQIVEDLRAVWDPAWTRRQLWDRAYSEATRPNVPSVLLELLSHQNYQDMRFGLDPRFRFDVARAVYKAVGRFLAGQRGERFVVQPLAPTHLAATFAPDGRVRLRWQTQEDPLEPTATPSGYVVYTRDGAAEGGGGGWDNGRAVAGTEATLPAPPPGIVRSYRVTATNAGGESEPSVALAVGLSGGGDRPLLVVDGFDRVAPPAAVEAVDDDGHPILGFSLDRDAGVPDGLDPATVGDQYDYDPTHPWIDDDAPGWGASHANLETRPIAGNTFDWAAVHGRSILAAGRSFVSASDEAVWDGAVNLAAYPLVDLILGEEKRTPWPVAGRPLAYEALPSALRQRLAAYLADGGKLVVSGAHWATDTAEGLSESDAPVAFLRDALGVRWRTDRAAVTGRVEGPRAGLIPPFTEFTYRTRLGPEGYAVESPDGIEPVDASGTTVLRYAENSISAAVARRGPTAVVAFGFPLEAVEADGARDLLIENALRFLGE